MLKEELFKSAEAFERIRLMIYLLGIIVTPFVGLILLPFVLLALVWEWIIFPFLIKFIANGLIIFFITAQESFSFQSLIPKEKREEILGDLDEIKESFIVAGYSNFRIWRNLSWMKIAIYFFLKKDQLASWLEEKFSIIK